MFTADQILALTLSQATQILPGDTNDIRKAFRILVKKWHPDHCDDPKAALVFEHVKMLRDHILTAGSSKPSASMKQVFTNTAGQSFAMSYLTRHQADIGEILVGSRTMVEIFQANMEDIASAEVDVLAGFHFADDAMRNQMAPFLPIYKERRDLKDGRVMLIKERKPGEVLLRDLLAKTGPMEPVHAAWLCSGLLNIASYLTYSNRVHGAIMLDTILIDPAAHSVRLASGWGFSCKSGERPVMLPGQALAVDPGLTIPGTVATFKLDLEMIRDVVRVALGVPSRSALYQSKLPVAVRDWLIMPPSDDGISDYGKWTQALEKGWGKRRFVDFPHNAEDIY